MHLTWICKSKSLDGYVWWIIFFTNLVFTVIRAELYFCLYWHECSKIDTTCMNSKRSSNKYNVPEFFSFIWSFVIELKNFFQIKLNVEDLFFIFHCLIFFSIQNTTVIYSNCIIRLIWIIWKLTVNIIWIKILYLFP